MDELETFLRLNAPLLVAACALFLTINSAWATRRHNKLMVRPHLTSFTTVELNSVTGVTTTTFTLTNSGLGPAFISTYEILRGEKAIHAETPIELEAALQATTGVPLIPNCNTFAVLKRGYVMAKDEDRILAVLNVANMTPAHDAELKKLRLLLTYKSAYDESFVYDTNVHIKGQQQ